MIIDTSVIIAILRDEADAAELARLIERAEVRRVSAVSYVEAGAVIDNYGDAVASRRLNQLLREADLTIESVTPRQAEIARAAYRDFGKGSGHPAKLNFGDCFSYALARDFSEPLLFKGKDFLHTDIEPAR